MGLTALIRVGANLLDDDDDEAAERAVAAYAKPPVEQAPPPKVIHGAIVEGQDIVSAFASVGHSV